MDLSNDISWNPIFCVGKKLCLRKSFTEKIYIAPLGEKTSGNDCLFWNR